ncbi:DNase I-like protein [Mycena indigotica]|uniref:DNase I-like protein n=1 Tax=Mycena indigotica TaxID=2126181 RepID=A0A8H6VRV4_9AGAR|nr:DNase I-like protein [Mycena indigotica]KAF7289711.1 DNase I-like protein [Mycena indigotica]
MSAVETSAFRALLRPGDTVKVLLDAFAIPPGTDPTTGAPLPPADAVALLADAERVRRASEDARNRRLVAVVVHNEGSEEGSVFVFRARSTGKQLEQSDILRVFPVFGNLNISMAQIRRTTLMDSLRSGSLPQAAPGFLSLTITQDDAASISQTPLTLCTQQVETLRVLLTECKRLKELADAPPISTAPVLTTFSWLSPYTARRAPLPPLFSIPEDLRIARTPLHGRLSAAFAGQPGDDAGDVVRIRDEWIRVKARDEAGTGATRLSIRIGTFNVNGNLPSQDLSLWLGAQPLQPYQSQGIVTMAPALPPLLTDLGKIARSDFEEVMTPATAMTDNFQSPVSPDPSVISPLAGSTSILSLVSPTSPESSSSTVSSASATATSPQSSVPSSATSTSSTATLTTASSSEKPDLIVLGFQELDLSTEALLYANSTAREEAWMEAIYAALGQSKDSEKEKGKNKGGYVKLASKQLVGMLIIALVKTELRACFDQVQTAAAGTGIMGLMGNKGGTALRMRFTPPVASPSRSSSRNPSILSISSAQTTSTTATGAQSSKSVKLRKPGSTILTFVNSHLAAFDEMVDRRNADYAELTKRLRFELGTLGGESAGSELLFGDGEGADAVPPTPTASAGAPMPAGTTCGVFESDVTFWLGDLNYRIDAPDGDVRTILASDEWEDGRLETLVIYDQLKAAIRANKAFGTFQEGTLAHHPTYRFNAGLLKDELGYDLKRRPAWTDRVLWASNNFTRVQQTSYTGHPQYSISDHKPVSSDFTLNMDVFDLPTAEKSADRLYRQLRGLEDAHEDHNAHVSLKVLESSVDLGKIGHTKSVTKQVTVKNIGRIPCAYRLVPIDGESAPHPDWLKVEPMAALLLPDEIVQLTLTTTIDNNCAARLNTQNKELNCTLILHTIMGKDHFVAVTAEYVPTCFGTSLSRLTRLPGPIRTGGDLLSEERAINAPREIMRLINWMMSSSVRMDKVFVERADEDIIDTIRECLDTGVDFPFTPDEKEDKVPVAFGETLLRLLNSLPEPLVRADLQPQCVLQTSRDEAFEMLDAFEPAAVNVWISVTAFLHFVCQSSAEPEAKTLAVARLFAPVLLRDDAREVSPVGRRNFLLAFIRP